MQLRAVTSRVALGLGTLVALGCGGPRAEISLASAAALHPGDAVEATLKNTGAVDLQHEVCLLALESSDGARVAVKERQADCEAQGASSILGPGDEQPLAFALEGVTPGAWTLVASVRFAGRAEGLVEVRSPELSVAAP